MGEPGSKSPAYRSVGPVSRITTAPDVRQLTRQGRAGISLREPNASAVASFSPTPPSSANAPTAAPATCAHCGDACPPRPIVYQEKAFCCLGCRSVYELLAASNLCQYYSLDPTLTRRKMADVELPGRFAYLDEPGVQARLLAFRSDTLARLTLHLPRMHCSSCIWLLEHLYRLNPHVVEARVNFPRKEISLAYRPQETSLREVVTLLTAIGYEPEITLAELGNRAGPASRALVYQLGLAGFAFGNVMLLAFPDYLASVGDLSHRLGAFFGYLSLALAVPVLLVSARGFFASAWQGVRQRYINLDFPISLGLLALFTVSTLEVLRGHGVGYFDSFTGLVFFLLIGKWAQQRTTDTLRFDRDFTSYFPVAVTRLTDGAEATTSVKELRVGDRIRVRHQEVIPADAILLRGAGEIDYSFVTGESAAVAKVPGEIIYAGGRQLADAVELEVVRDVSQGYLTQLWNNPAFAKSERADGGTGSGGLETYANHVGRWFVAATLVLALGAVAYWGGYRHDAAMAVRAFTSVLVIACPCALSLATPFALGTAQGIFGRHKLYLKNPGVAEALGRANTIVFDKTGTLTDVSQSRVRFEGAPLTPRQRARLAALVGCSTHPLSQRLRQELGESEYDDFVGAFTEKPGRGLRATVAGLEVRVGRTDFVGATSSSSPPPLPHTSDFDGGQARVSVAFGADAPVGEFVFENVYRDGLPEVLAALRTRYHLVVLSGDHAGEAARLRELFGPAAELRFRQSPLAKLQYVQALQRQGRTVVMIGDGLNDAGALRAADVGIALTDTLTHFSPACDAILDAASLRQLPAFLRFTRASLQAVLVTFGVSLLYNAAGLTLAVQGQFTPIASAILMPISSLSVLLTATALVRRAARRHRL